MAIASFDLWLAIVFEEKGEYDKALEIHERLASQMSPDCSLFLTRKTFVVIGLFKTGQYQKALEEVDQILELQVNFEKFGLLRLLGIYVDILGASQIKFAIKYTSFVKQIIDSLALEFSHLDFSNLDNLVEIVKEISVRNGRANRRYSKLILELPKISSEVSKIAMLKNYIANEDFEFYRNLAIEYLEDLGYGTNSESASS